METGTTDPQPPAKKSNVLLWVLLGVGGCMFVGCLGISVISALAYMGSVEGRPEAVRIDGVDGTGSGSYTVLDENGNVQPIGADEHCCCMSIGDNLVFKFETAKTCIDGKGGRCMMDDACDDAPEEVTH